MYPLGAGLGNVNFEIQICIGYKLPTFWEYNSVEILHQRVSVRPWGAGFRNILFYMYIFILDISYQHLGNTCLLNLYTGIVSVLDGFPNTSLVLVEYGHSLIINLSTGIRKSFPVGREGLTVLKSILPC